jgi:hypothetical protein
MMLIDSANNGADLPAQVQDYFHQRAAHRQQMQRQLYTWQKDIMACIDMRWIVIHKAAYGVRPPWNIQAPNGGNNNVQQGVAGQ